MQEVVRTQVPNSYHSHSQWLKRPWKARRMAWRLNLEADGGQGVLTGQAAQGRFSGLSGEKTSASVSNTFIADGLDAGDEDPAERRAGEDAAPAGVPPGGVKGVLASTRDPDPPGPTARAGHLGSAVGRGRPGGGASQVPTAALGTQRGPGTSRRTACVRTAPAPRPRTGAPRASRCSTSRRPRLLRRLPWRLCPRGPAGCRRCAASGGSCATAATTAPAAAAPSGRASWRRTCRAAPSALPAAGAASRARGAAGAARSGRGPRPPRRPGPGKRRGSAPGVGEGYTGRGRWLRGRPGPASGLGGGSVRGAQPLAPARRAPPALRPWPRRPQGTPGAAASPPCPAPQPDHPCSSF
ncbi:LOW QUALITY PROTEIN: uncharacterized protein [Manis javanica]|uniref:LOW QUALITY PROTEIN: uncharacterized protein n=1 Tax=Manis javanica TaxID=9974 RepID=UPI003C6D1B08